MYLLPVENYFQISFQKNKEMKIIDMSGDNALDTYTFQFCKSKFDQWGVIFEGCSQYADRLLRYD